MKRYHPSLLVLLLVFLLYGVDNTAAGRDIMDKSTTQTIEGHANNDKNLLWYKYGVNSIAADRNVADKNFILYKSGVNSVAADRNVADKNFFLYKFAFDDTIVGQDAVEGSTHQVDDGRDVADKKFFLYKTGFDTTAVGQDATEESAHQVDDSYATNGKNLLWYKSGVKSVATDRNVADKNFILYKSGVNSLAADPNIADKNFFLYKSEFDDTVVGQDAVEESTHQADDGHATDELIRIPVNLTIFFFEKDLWQGNKMTLQFTPEVTSLRISHRDTASSIPFTSAKFLDILNHFSISANSKQANLVKHTLLMCESPALADEVQYCPTSLESMIELSKATIGTSNIQSISTKVERNSAGLEPDSDQQEFVIESVSLLKSDDNLVACHAQMSWPYTVFYCHKAKRTNGYRVHLVGEDGTRVETLAMCHCDTTTWNPKHLAFKMLHVKPGKSAEICHFLPQDGIVWAPKY